jgi:hypothetical protein
MKVYLVWFETGEYEDRRDIVMQVFDGKSKAEKYAAQMNKKLNDYGLSSEGDSSNRHNTQLRDQVAEEMGLGGYGIDYVGGHFTADTIGRKVL